MEICKFKIYESYIKETFHRFIDSYELSKSINWPDCHSFQKTHCIEMNVPRQVGKTQTLLELAEQYQKVIFISMNQDQAKYAFRHFPKDSIYNRNNIFSINSLANLRDKFIGVNLKDYIFVLDEVSLLDFFTNLDKKAPKISQLIYNGEMPVFSVTTKL